MEENDIDVFIGKYYAKIFIYTYFNFLHHLCNFLNFFSF